MKSRGYTNVDVPAVRRAQADDMEQVGFAAVADLEALTGAPATPIPVTHPLGMRYWTARSRMYDVNSWKAAIRGENEKADAA
jgi:hypothetical protein